MTEVGGKVPGGFAGDATEVFQEGIRIPPLKIVDAGEDVEAVWNIILANVRTPRTLVRRHEGDDRLALRRRATRRTSSWRSYGVERSSGRSRRRSRTTPSGACGRRSRRCRTASTRSRTTSSTTTASPTRPRTLKVEVTIDGDQMTVDYTGSRPSAARAGQLHVRRDRLGDLQRAPPPDRPHRFRRTTAATARFASSRRPGRS